MKRSPISIRTVVLVILVVCVFFVIITVHDNKSQSKKTELPQPMLGNFSEWDSYISSVGAEKAKEVFYELNDKAQINTQHPNVHTFARALYNNLGVDGVKYCDHHYSAGCYHQFFLETYAREGDRAYKVLIDACLQSATTQAHERDCYHALGHGVSYANQETDPLQGLNTCMQIENSTFATRCADGVFMEFFSPSLLETPASLASTTIKTDNYVNRPDNAELTDQLKFFNDICVEKTKSYPKSFQNECTVRFMQYYSHLIANLYTDVSEFLPLAKDLCNAVEESLKNMCHYTIGHFTLMTFADESDDVETYQDLCSSQASEEAARWCEVGIIERLHHDINANYNLEEAKRDIYTKLCRETQSDHINDHSLCPE